MRPIPNAIEYAQTAAQFFGDSRSHLNSCLRTPPPTASELIEILAIRAIPANRQPLALRQSSQESQISRTQRQTQFALTFQPSRQREPFILGTFIRNRRVAEVRYRARCDRDGKLSHFAALPQPKEHGSGADGYSRYQREPQSEILHPPVALFRSRRKVKAARPEFADEVPQSFPGAVDGMSDLGEQLVKPRRRARVVCIMPAIDLTL